jgi:hypothetical protein
MKTHLVAEEEASFWSEAFLARLPMSTPAARMLWTRADPHARRTDLPPTHSVKSRPRTRRHPPPWPRCFIVVSLLQVYLIYASLPSPSGPLFILEVDPLFILEVDPLFIQSRCTNVLLTYTLLSYIGRVQYIFI